MFFKAIVLCAALECGFISGGIFNYASNDIAWKDIGALYTNIDAKLCYGPAYVSGSTKCFFTPMSLVAYSPFQMTFNIGVGLDIENIKIGYEHSCFHPMQPYLTVWDTGIIPKYEGVTDKFFVRIETK